MQAYRSTFAFWRPTPRQRRRGWRSQGVIGANVDIGAFELDIADVLLADCVELSPRPCLTAHLGTARGDMIAR
jgi:hypothetical protein